MKQHLLIAALVMGMSTVAASADEAAPASAKSVEEKAAPCAACHGPTGLGNPAASVPAVRGQYAVYSAQQLRNYANGTRTSDGATRVMRDIAETLSENDIKAVAAYMQGLQ